jgi:competence CoiA-like predicted nuclease
MHAKVSSRGLRFAHDAAASMCPSAGKIPAHRELKNNVAEMIRDAGWAAQVEAEPSPSDTGGWRADVLAELSGLTRRVAFEVQLAGMTSDEGKERSARYAADGIEVVWISTKHARWLYGIPGVRVRPSPEAFGALVADRGLAALTMTSCPRRR